MSVKSSEQNTVSLYKIVSRGWHLQGHMRDHLRVTGYHEGANHSETGEEVDAGRGPVNP